MFLVLKHCFSKIAHNFQTSDDRKNPITYLKSGGKNLLETIKNYVKQKMFKNLLPNVIHIDEYLN